MRRSSFETLLYGYLPLVRYILDHQAAVEWSELRGQEVRFFPLSLRMSEMRCRLKKSERRRDGGELARASVKIALDTWRALAPPWGLGT